MVNPVSPKIASSLRSVRAVDEANGSKSVQRHPPEGALQSAHNSAKTSVSDIVQAGPPVDVSHVRDVAAQIANGSYPVDPDRIADAMLDFWAGGSHDN